MGKLGHNVQVWRFTRGSSYSVIQTMENLSYKFLSCLSCSWGVKQVMGNLGHSVKVGSFSRDFIKIWYTLRRIEATIVMF